MNNFLSLFIKDRYKKPMTALDLGCGEGLDIKELQTQGWVVKGVDLPKVNLNNPYNSKLKFDLVFSIAVLQFIKNKEIFIETCYNNLKKDGDIFLLTFDKSDRIVKNCFTKTDIRKLLKGKFNNIKIEKLEIDDDHRPIGKHKHVVLIATASKGLKI
jgi:2-polyprenyl-3-methyl-5-hydroxy-6-metoxy-1,4-benzoquinol methylase